MPSSTPREASPSRRLLPDPQSTRLLLRLRVQLPVELLHSEQRVPSRNFSSTCALWARIPGDRGPSLPFEHFWRPQPLPPPNQVEQCVRSFTGHVPSDHKEHCGTCCGGPQPSHLNLAPKKTIQSHNSSEKSSGISGCNASITTPALDAFAAFPRSSPFHGSNASYLCLVC